MTVLAKRALFGRSGFLAIAPSAMFEEFDVPEGGASAELATEVAVVHIQGPLTRTWSCWDCYEAIGARIAAAAASTAQVVVLRIDSPGGEAAGCFEAVAVARAVLKESGKRVIAFVDKALSAGYAWACAADEIVIPPSGQAGSVGVISARVDATEAARKSGVRFEFTMSGYRKAYGNPQTKVTEDEREKEREAVQDLADQFFALVADSRDTSVDTVASLEAGTFLGRRAVDAGLADRVETFEELLATLAPNEEKPMTLAEMIASLRATIKAGGPEAATARKELLALSAESAPAAESDEDSDEESDEDEESAESDEDEESAESDEDEESAESDEDEDAPPPKKGKDARAARSGRVSGTTARGLARQVESLAKSQRKLAAHLDGEKRRALLDSRPDISPELRRTLAGKPAAEVKEILAGIPKPKRAKPAASATTVPATQPASAAAPAQTPADADIGAQLDIQMGLVSLESRGVQKSPTKLVLGAPVPVPQTAQAAK
jgi:ClpP class serine protease